MSRKMFYQNLSNGHIYCNMKEAAEALKMSTMTFHGRLRAKKLPVVELTDVQVALMAMNIKLVKPSFKESSAR